MYNMARQELTKEDFKASFAVIKETLKPHQATVIFLIILSVIAAAADSFVPLLAGRIFDSIIAVAGGEQIAATGILLIIAIWFGLKVISDIAGWRIDIGTEKLGTRVYAEYISWGFSQLLFLPISFHKKHKQGVVGEKINRAANSIDTIISRVLVRVVPEFLTVALVFVLAFLIEPLLTLILAVAIPIYIFILWLSVSDVALLQRKMFRAWSGAYGDAYEALGNIQEIKQAASEEYERRELARKFVRRAAGIWIRLHVAWGRLSFAQKVLITLTQLAIFTASIFLVRDGSITPGELVAFNAYAAILFGPFVILGQNWQTIQNGAVVIREARKLLTTPTETYEPKGAVALKNLRGEVEFKNVSFRYEAKKEVLSDVSFHARPGEIVALVGESGVGKSTIADLILRFYFPTEGEIFIDGHDIRKLELKAYRRQISVVPQEVSLFNDTIEENIRYGSFTASQKAMEEAARLAHAREFIEKFPKKYKTLVGWRGIKLSVGQKQRIAIARAILQNPHILILDEPTSALDAKSEKYIQESLEELMKGRTTFIIAHRLSTVRKADKIIVLDKGKIAEQGKHDELLAIPNGIYRHLYNLQIGFVGNKKA